MMRPRMSDLPRALPWLRARRLMGARAMLAVGRRMVAAIMGRSHAHRLMIRVAVAQPAGVGFAHPALVKLDAIVVAATPARAIFARPVAIVAIGIIVATIAAVIAIVTLGISGVVIVGLVEIRLGGADQDHGGEGGKGERLLHQTLLSTRRSRKVNTLLRILLTF